MVLIYITTLWTETNFFSLISQSLPTESTHFLWPIKEGKEVRKIRGVAGHGQPERAASTSKFPRGGHWSYETAPFSDWEITAVAKRKTVWATSTEEQHCRALGLILQLELNVSQVKHINTEQTID